MSELLESFDRGWSAALWLVGIRRLTRDERRYVAAIATIRPRSTPDTVVRPVRSDDETKAVEGI